MSSEETQREDTEHTLKVIKRLSTSKTRTTDLVQDLKNGRIFVISIFPKSKSEEAQNMTAQKYYDKYGRLSHPCLAPMHGNYLPNFDEKNTIKFAMPYFINSSLANVISLEAVGRHPFLWTPTKKSIVAFGIAVAIKALNHEKIVHGLLYPSNILLTRTFEPLVSEFWMREVYDLTTIDPTNKSFINLDEELQPSSDIYSFGCILCSMIYKEKVFSESLRNTKAPEALNNVIQSCLEPDPKKRPTIDSILEQIINKHAVFEGTDNAAFSAFVNRVSKAKIERPVFRNVPIPPYADDKKIAEQYKALTDAGDAHAALLNGINRREGRGCSVNKNAALKSLRVAADAGVAEAQYHSSIIMSTKPKNQKVRTEANNYLVEAADNGFADAQYRLGMMLERGDNFPYNAKLAEKYLKLAADQGHLDAQVQISELYKNGGFGAPDEESCIKYKKLAAFQGNGEAQLSYANYLISKDFESNKHEITELLVRASSQEISEAQSVIAKLITEHKISLDTREDEMKFIRISATSGKDPSVAEYFSDLVASGEVVLDNPTEAAKFFKMAADRGNDRAMVEYSKILFEGRGVNANVEEALNYLKLSADLNKNPESAFNYADKKLGCRKDNQEIKNCMSYMEMAADAGLPQAQTCYGTHISDTFPMKAKEYLEKAAEQNYAEAHFQLYRLFSKDKIDKEGNNKQTGLEHLKKSADLGLPKAMYQYAKQCVKHKCLKGDDDLYVKYYQMAADAGDDKAQCRYAEMLSDGDGVEMNLPLSAQYFEKAAKQGNKKACFSLGLIYEIGDGVQADDKKAKSYMKKAADKENGKPYRGAATELERMNEPQGKFYHENNDDEEECFEEDLEEEDQDSNMSESNSIDNGNSEIFYPYVGKNEIIID